MNDLKYSPSNSMSCKTSGLVTKMDINASSATWLDITSNLERNWCPSAQSLHRLYGQGWIAHLEQISFGQVQPPRQHPSRCFSHTRFSVTQAVSDYFFSLSNSKYTRVRECLSRKDSRKNSTPEYGVNVPRSCKNMGERDGCARKIIQGSTANFPS